MNTPDALQALLDLAAAIVSHAERGLDTGLAPEALGSLSEQVLGLQLA